MHQAFFLQFLRWLKITEKVSFSNASEASYVYILSGQKISVIFKHREAFQFQFLECIVYFLFFIAECQPIAKKIERHGWDRSKKVSEKILFTISSVPKKPLCDEKVCDILTMTFHSILSVIPSRNPPLLTAPTLK